MVKDQKNRRKRNAIGGGREGEHDGRFAAGVVDDDLERGGSNQRMTRDSQSTHCPVHPADLAALSEHRSRGKGRAAFPRRYYSHASAYDGIAVTLDDSIDQDYLLDNVCFVQT